MLSLIDVILFHSMILCFFVVGVAGAVANSDTCMYSIIVRSCDPSRSTQFAPSTMPPIRLTLLFFILFLWNCHTNAPYYIIFQTFKIVRSEKPCHHYARHGYYAFK